MSERQTIVAREKPKEKPRHAPAKGEQIKIAAAIFVIVGCLSWVGIYVFSNASGHREAKPPSSPGWTAAAAINEKLAQDRAFSDVGVALANESPLKLDVNGAVFSQADLERLPGLLHDFNPDAEYDMHVTLMRR